MPREHDHYENLARQILLRHELQKPPGFTPGASERDVAAMLARRAAHLIDEDAFLHQLAERSGDPLAMRHELSRLELPPALAMLLAVVERTRPALLHHLLLVSVIAHYLALRRELAARETAIVLLAALCHDLGELYTDPVLLEPEHVIGDEERRYIYVHPITGHLVASEIAELDPNVAIAVLQHQERLDGSGYPYGVRGDRICTSARIVGMADVCAAILTRFGSQQRLGALMRLNRQKFDIGLLAALHEGIGRPAPAPQPAATMPHARLFAAAELLDRWNDFRPALARSSDEHTRRELAFLIERMAALRHMLLQFGFDPSSPQLLMELLAEDPLIATELDAALDEVHWQFCDLEREIARRRQVIKPLLDADGKRLLNEWDGQLRAYIAMAGD